MSGLPQALYTAAQVRALDAAVARALQLAPGQLMERAGEAALAALRMQWPRAHRIAVACGPGNNGGDGFVLARRAQAAGLAPVVLLAQDAAPRGDALIAWQALRASPVPVEPLTSDALADGDVVVDAVFGIGVQRAIEGRWREAIACIDAVRKPVFALDLPSGIDSDTGAERGIAVRADLTLSLIALKPGLFTGAGAACAGRVLLDDLGAPAEAFGSITPAARRIDRENLRGILPPRPRSWHKGDAGHIVVVGGNAGMGGAARMAGEAAYRAGAGLVTLITHANHAACIANDCPELIVRAAQTPEAQAAMRNADVIALGPGLGQDAWAQSLFADALAIDRPLIVDADGLNLLATATQQRRDWILTPHPGEAARLLTIHVAAVQADRPAAARAIAHRYGGVCVLKGAGTVVADVDADTYWLCDRGDPAMASAGMGDVLTGIVAGLRAQGLVALDAARLGVWVHASAGEDAARNGVGIRATDLFADVRAHLQSVTA